MVYLDNAFISMVYEMEKGIAPSATITRTEGIEVGASFPILKGGATSVESRSYSVSTIQMLDEVIDALRRREPLEVDKISIGSPSSIGWVSGQLSVYAVVSRRTQGGREEKTGEDAVFGITSEGGLKLLLITSPEYFVTGVDAFLHLSRTVVGQIVIPVEALVRVYSAKSSFEDWIAVPLVILEQE